MIFDKCYQKVKMKLMKSFDATKKKNALGYNVFEGFIPTPKDRPKWAFCSIFGDIQA